LLGSKVDTLSGLSKAEIVTSFTIITAGDFGEEPLVDSLILSLYVAEVDGDTTQEMHLLIYEFLDTLFYENDYYSDYDVTGKYDPEPLVDETIIPKRNTYYEFNISDQDFIDRVIAAAKDTVFLNRPLTMELFRGLYITTESVSSGGAFAKVQLANGLSGLKFRYLHDSILVDTADLDDYRAYTIGFNEYYAEKVNIFHHDYSGSYLESIIDNPDADPKIAYVQGMAGVNTKISLSNLDESIGTGIIALNTANLLFYIVPDSISGINAVNYPIRLKIETQFADNSYQPLYDQIINSNSSTFGRLSQSNERSAFLEPLYFYNFQIGRHLQSVVSGELDNGDLYIYIDDANLTSNVLKFWSNYSDQSGSLRLELIYTKF
jgi:hypothetical protein